MPSCTEIDYSVSIKSRHWCIGRHTRIGKNVLIDCEELFIGEGVIIDNNVTIKGVGVVDIGNYSVIAENVFINGLKGAKFKLGNLSWVGRDSILNASNNLIIGNGTCIGISSRIFTHGCWFEAAEGYKLNYKDVYVGNNVWLAVNVIVQPGTYINDNIFVNSGGVVNGTLESQYIYSGVPATKQFPLSKIKRDINVKEKMSIIANYFSSRLIDNGWRGTFIKEVQFGNLYTFKKSSRTIDIVFSEDINNIPDTRRECICFLPEVSSRMRLSVKESDRILLVDLTHKISYGDMELAHLLLIILRDFIFRFYPYHWNKEE